MNTDLHRLTIASASERMRRGALRSAELVETLLERIARLDPAINAFITLTADHAREAARRADAEIARGGWRGPLHGIPFGLKDVYSTAGIRTTGHSRVGADHVPRDDAAVTRRLREAGAVLMGKLATYQFTHGGPSFDPPWPPARNPWNTAHDAGGSSSGSAAAVAAGFVPAAMGTDTGGSVRIPASFCGLAGLKPTFGLVSRQGVIPNSWSFDHCGPMAATVEDCAILLQAIAGYDPRDPASADFTPPDYRAALEGGVAGLRIGVVRHFWEEDLALGADVAAAMEAAITVFRELGAVVSDVRMRPLQDYYDVKNVITKAEVFCVHQADLGARPDDFGPDFLATTLGGCLFQAVDYVQAQRERTTMIDESRELFRRFDILVTANVGPAPRLARRAALDLWQAKTAPASLCIPFSMIGAPALSLCNGFTAGGLPLGMQIVAAPFADALALRAGHAYERATAWHRRRAEPDPQVQVPVVPPPLPIAAAEDTDGTSLAAWCAERAGLTLAPESLQRLRLLEPHAEAMAGRLRRPRDHAIEIASVFRASRDE